MRRPGDDELHVLAALAAHVAQALEDALVAAEAHRHRAALEHLLAVSVRLTETLAVRPILQSVCEAIRAALGFSHVSVELLDDGLGPHRPRGRRRLEPRGDRPLGHRPRGARPPARPGLRGRGLLPAARRRGLRAAGRGARPTGPPTTAAGPHAWDHHWLVLPLHAHRRRPRRRDLGGRARGPPAALARAPADPADLRQPGLDRGRRRPPPSRRPQYLADHDPLTRLGNRRAFTRQLAQETYRAARYGEPFALVVLDVDGFKALNDRHGHAAGDAALGAIGGVLQRTLRLRRPRLPPGRRRVRAACSTTAAPRRPSSSVDRVCEALDALEVGEGTRLRASFGVAVGAGETRRPRGAAARGRRRDVRGQARGRAPALPASRAPPRR